MKKHQIKLVGVCAATLLTVGALTPTAASVAHATDNGISTLATVYTQNNLKPAVEMTVADFELSGGLRDELAGWVAATASGTPTPVQSDLVTSDALKDLFNHPANVIGQYVSLNVGLSNEDVDPSSGNITPKDSKSINNIIVESNYQPLKEGGYVAGDKINISFIGVDANGDTVKVLAKTVVTLVAEKEDYNAAAQDITAAVGDVYEIQNGVVVTNKETGKALTYINQKLFADGTASVDPDGNVTIGTKKYDQGTWFTLVDATMDKDGTAADPFDDSTATDPERIKEGDINPATGLNDLVYDSAVKFNQTLQVVIGGAGFTDGTAIAADDTVFYLNRTINIVDDKEVNPVPVYRAYNSNDGDHLFTTSQSEYNNVVSAGWAAENIAWNAASSNADGGKVVYRVYNANSGEHFYTASREEYMNLGKAGWTQEGEAFYSPKAEGNVAVYRAFNPNATGPGSHMFTTSKSEYDNIVKAGWTGEGIAFYGLAEK